MPVTLSDLVQFSITSPTILVPSGRYFVDVWAHMERQRGLVIKRAAEQSAESDIRIRSKGPVSVSRGTVLTVRLQLEGITISPAQDSILWEGEIGTAEKAFHRRVVGAKTPAASHIGGRTKKRIGPRDAGRFEVMQKRV